MFKFAPQVLISLLLIITACAKQSSPTGGEKDTIPPELIASTPTNRTTNQNPSKITLTFNEAIQVFNAKEEILITPRIENNYDISYNKKTVTLKFNESLKENTTYTINFRNAISDLTEKNAPNNLQLIFSTGPILDSLGISGTIEEALTTNNKENITVGLYNNSDTLDFLSALPYYLTKTDATGKFTFENLKNDEYRLFAFEDINKNLKPDTDNEMFAFEPNTIIPLYDSINYKLLLIKQNLTTPKILRTVTKNKSYVIKFNKGITHYTITPTLPNTILNSQADQISIYSTNNIDNISTHTIHYTDSASQSKTDTIQIAFNNQQRKPDKLAINYKFQAISSHNQILKANLRANKPIEIKTLDSIYLSIDTLLTIPIKHRHIVKELPNQYHISLPLEAMDSLYNFDSEEDVAKTNQTTPEITFHSGKGSFYSIHSDTSTQHTTNIPYLAPFNSGTILYTVNTNEKNYIIQLLNDKYKIVDQHFSNKKGEFKNIPAATYYLRIVKDLNQNNQWDAGNLFSNTLPEPILFYLDISQNKAIKLRSNWELGPLVIEF